MLVNLGVPNVLDIVLAVHYHCQESEETDGDLSCSYRWKLTGHDKLPSGVKHGNLICNLQKVIKGVKPKHVKSKQQAETM